VDYERLLISKLAQTGRIQSALTDGIRSDHFTDSSLGEIYDFLASHARRYKQAPSFATVRKEFPNHNFELSDESHEYLRDEFIKQVKKRNAITALRDLAGIIEGGNVSEIDQLFLEKSRELAQLVPSSSLHRFSNMKDRIEEYLANEESQHGIKMGIPAFDALTQGIQPHEYITIAGWQGTGKSTLAQWMLFNAWTQNKTPMYISLEMEAKALLRKWDTMAVNFEYDKLKSHKLSPEDLSKWEAVAESAALRKNDIVVLDDVRDCTVDRIYAEIHRWKPDIVCIDYITLMDINRSAGNQMWEKITYITQALKQISRTTKVPIIGVAQTNIGSAEQGAKLENISYSRSIGQDSDLVLGLYSNDEMKKEKQMEVRMLKNRDGMTSEAMLKWDMSMMKFGPWSTTDLFTRREVVDA
jgi:replicative DNA helicase